MTDLENPNTSQTIAGGSPLICGECGYDLRSASDRCPECGRRFVPNHLTDALIPWEQRRQIGRVTAYVRTVRMVVRRRREVAAKVNMPVSLTDAKRFRRVTMLLAFAPVAALAGWLGWHLPAMPPTQYEWQREWERLFNQPASLAVLLAGVLAALFLADDVARWFIPRGLSLQRRERVRAISYYGCAALGAVPLVPIACGLVFALAWFSGESNWFGTWWPLAAGWAVLLLFLFILAGPVALLVMLSMWMQDSVELIRLSSGHDRPPWRWRTAGILMALVRVFVLLFVPAVLEVLAALVALFVLSWS